MKQDVWQERRMEEPKRDGDVRSEWERDYARIIHSAAFRRLQSKTQVLGLGESDFYRTRLTHSMEVAQIGVGIVRWLKDKHKQDQEIIKCLPSSALMSTICLAHDMGHPPFGHGGEIALNMCMRSYGGFEGNGQTLRILSKLDKYTDNYGMNPTRRVLLGVLKYPSNYSSVVREKFYVKFAEPIWLSKAQEQKPPKCYLDDEENVVEWILEPLSEYERLEFIQLKDNGEKKHAKPFNKSLDTSIMELADDISYSLHDLEDAISLGMVRKESWREHNEGKEELFKACGLEIENLTNDLFSQESYNRKRAIGDLVNKFIVSSYVAESSVLKAKNSLIKFSAYLPDEYRKLLDHIFDIVKNEVIFSSNVQLLEFKGQKIIVELFNALNSDPNRLLPKSTLQRYCSAEGESKKERVICDFISGMTDEYATRLYEKIYHPHKGSIFDRL